MVGGGGFNYSYGRGRITGSVFLDFYVVRFGYV